MFNYSIFDPLFLRDSVLWNEKNKGISGYISLELTRLIIGALDKNDTWLINAVGQSESALVEYYTQLQERQFYSIEPKLCASLTFSLLTQNLIKHEPYEGCRALTEPELKLAVDAFAAYRDSYQFACIVTSIEVTPIKLDKEHDRFAWDNEINQPRLNPLVSRNDIFPWTDKELAQLHLMGLSLGLKDSGYMSPLNTPKEILENPFISGFKRINDPNLRQPTENANIFNTLRRSTNCANPESALIESIILRTQPRNNLMLQSLQDDFLKTLRKSIISDTFCSLDERARAVTESPFYSSVDQAISSAESIKELIAIELPGKPSNMLVEQCRSALESEQYRAKGQGAARQLGDVIDEEVHTYNNKLINVAYHLTAIWNKFNELIIEHGHEPGALDDALELFNKKPLLSFCDEGFCHDGILGFLKAQYARKDSSIQDDLKGLIRLAPRSLGLTLMNTCDDPETLRLISKAMYDKLTGFVNEWHQSKFSCDDEIRIAQAFARAELISPGLSKEFDLTVIAACENFEEDRMEKAFMQFVNAEKKSLMDNIAQGNTQKSLCDTGFISETMSL